MVLSTLVLVSDALPSEREALSGLLGSAQGLGSNGAGARVTTARSLADGLQLLRAGEFDLVLYAAKEPLAKEPLPKEPTAKESAATELAAKEPAAKESSSLHDLRTLAPRTAIVALVEDDAAGALALERGADDWIAKDELAPRSFTRVVRRAIHTRRALEEARSARFLAEGGKKLLGAREVQDVVATLTAHVVPALADACVIDLIDDGAEDAAVPSRTTIVPPFDVRARVAAAQLPRGVVAKECLLVPLTIDGAPPLAVMTLFAIDRARRWRDDDLETAAGLALRAAFAIEHARFERSRDDTLSVVSHDLRNPLNVITVAVASLRKGSVPGERLPVYLDKMKRAADRMNRLIQDVLDVSRLEAQKVAFDRSLHAVEELVYEAVRLAEPLAREKAITIASSVEPGLPEILVDRDRMLQVFANLLANAIKASDKGSTVTLAATRDGADVRLDVVDTGTGISAEHMPRLFDRFYQAQRADRNGAGLGLAIARRILLGHDGKLTAESEQGKGSTFHVRLPATTPAIAVASQAG